MADWYVTNAGKGLRTGTGGNYDNAIDYASIDSSAHAFWAGVAAGDNIYIGDACAGDFLYQNKTFATPVKIIGLADGAGVPTITSGTTSAIYLLGSTGTTGGLRFENLRIVAGAAGHHTTYLRDNGAAIDNVTFYNCDIISAANHTMYMCTHAADVTNAVYDTCDFTITSAAGGDATAIQCVVDGTSISSVALYNCTITSTGAVTNNLIVCGNNTNFIMDKCVLSGGKFAVYITAANNISLTNNTISGTVSDAVEIAGTAGTSITGSVTVIGNTVYDSVSRGIYLYNLTSALSAHCVNNHVYDVSDSGAGNGYGIEAETNNTRVNVSGNRVHDCDLYGIILKDCSWGMAEGNNITKIDQGGKNLVESGLYFKGSASCWAINNYIDCSTYGIKLEDNGAVPCTNIKLADNNINSAVRYQIAANQTCNYLTKDRRKRRLRWL